MMSLTLMLDRQPALPTSDVSLSPGSLDLWRLVLSSSLLSDWYNTTLRSICTPSSQRDVCATQMGDTYHSFACHIQHFDCWVVMEISTIDQYVVFIFIFSQHLQLYQESHYPWWMNIADLSVNSQLIFMAIFCKLALLSNHAATILKSFKLFQWRIWHVKYLRRDDCDYFIKWRHLLHIKENNFITIQRFECRK